jgi:hypothetical protein
LEFRLQALRNRVIAELRTWRISNMALPFRPDILAERGREFFRRDNILPGA